MAQATLNGCFATMLLLLVALYAGRHTAVGQQTTSTHDTADDNELQISHTTIAEPLNRIVESLSMLQQENAKLSQYIMRLKAETETASKARFELLKGGLNELKSECAEMKPDVKADIAEMRTHLRQISAENSHNETTARLEQLETDFNATLMDMKQHILQQVNANVEWCCAHRQPDQCSNQTQPRDCGDILSLGFTSNGTYTVYVGNTSRPLLVYCDMTTDNGGWTVFQRRQDGSENFQRNWVDYASGFGDLYREFWLALRIDLADFNGNSRYAEYSDFKLGAPSDKYELISVGTYSGNAGDSRSIHVGYGFSTLDQDNDIYPRSCAVEFKGAWWYNKCHYSNLNGYYYGGPHASFADGIEWYTWTGLYYSLKFTEMKVR